MAIVSFRAVSHSFNGQWCWDKSDESETFSFNLYKKNDRYYGGYYGVAYDGNRINTYNSAFDFKDNGQDTVQIKMVLEPMSVGLIQLKLLNEALIEYTVIKEPPGEFYIPSQGRLIPCR